MKDSLRAVLDNFSDFQNECCKVSRLLRKNPKDDMDKYNLWEFYPTQNGYTIYGTHNEPGWASWSASFPSSLLDMTDDEIISWRKENLGY